MLDMNETTITLYNLIKKRKDEKDYFVYNSNIDCFG